MKSKTIVGFVALGLLLFTESSLARKPIIPDDETLAQVARENSKTIEEKEWKVDENLSLFQCFGKIFAKTGQGLDQQQLISKLEKSGITIERSKKNSANDQFYLIISMVSHDKEELSRLMESSVIGKVQQNRNLRHSFLMVFCQ
jgi:hypothetical protein